MKEKTDVSSMSMAAQAKMRYPTIVENSDERVSKSSAQKPAFQSQQDKEVERGHKTKMGQTKTMVAPGSLSDYIKMKAMLKEKEVRKKQNEVFMQQTNTQPNVLQVLKHQIAGSQMERFCAANSFLYDLEEENQNSMYSDELESVHESDDDAEGGNDDVQGGNDGVQSGTDKQSGNVSLSKNFKAFNSDYS